MVLAATGELLAHATEERRAIGAFNVIQLEHAEGLVAAAETSGLPSILQISENAVRYHGALEPIGVATLALARAARVPIAVHLDHATDLALVHEAIRLGFSSIMFDGSTLPYGDNVACTADLAARCHSAGVHLEAELGEVGGKDGVHAPGARTDPDEAAAFVDATGVDALAIAVGTSHAMVVKEAELDFALIERIRDAVPVPLVLHGSSGVSDDNLLRAIRAGIAKVNVATGLNKAFTNTVREELARHPELVDTRRFFAPARDALAAEAQRYLQLLSGARPDPPAPVQASSNASDAAETKPNTTTSPSDRPTSPPTSPTPKPSSKPSAPAI